MSIFHNYPVRFVLKQILKKQMEEEIENVNTEVVLLCAASHRLTTML